MKKICIFTGAGIDAESGIETFRDNENGLWYNFNVDDVATVEGWERDPKKVMDFHNILRAKLHDVEPNSAHLAIAELEKEFEVTVITQNVSNLQEKAGSTKVYHLHGELFKSRAIVDEDGVQLYDCFGDLNVGDKDEEGNDLRPHTVLFGEYPFNYYESVEAVIECDILVIIGTSLPIGYTHPLLACVRPNIPVYYIDPDPAKDLDFRGVKITYIEDVATKGVVEFIKKIKNDEDDI